MALFCVSYRALHYRSNEVPWSMGYKVIEAPVPACEADVEAIAREAERRVLDVPPHAPRPAQVRRVEVTGMHRLDATS